MYDSIRQTIAGYKDMLDDVVMDSLRQNQENEKIKQWAEMKRIAQ